MDPNTRDEITESAADRLTQAIDAHEQGQTLVARGLLAQLVRQAPEDAEVRLWAGILAFETGDFAEAAAHFRHASRLTPQQAMAHYNLGLCLEALQENQGAIAAYSQAIACQADHVQAYNNRGILHAASGQHQLALHDYEQAIRLAPDYADGYFNRGVLRAEQDRLIEAEQDYQRAIDLEPNHESAQFALAVCWLSLGRWQQGWPQYEWRWRYAAVNRSRPPRIAPPWDGYSSLQGKRLLIDYEQGYGDCLQFCRFVPTLAALGANIQLRIQPALRPLLGSLSGVQRLISDEPPTPCDYQLNLMSLPALLAITPENIPASQGYLSAPAERVAHWQSRLTDVGRPRIGLVWAGNPHHSNDRQRSLPLAQLLAALPSGPSYLSLQRHLSAEDAAWLPTRPDICPLGEELTDFADTAALCSQLDRVICVDTAVAHLCGALGVPVWILLPFAADWRWLRQREDSPWYATARLFRQSQPGDWHGVLVQISDRLGHGHEES